MSETPADKAKREAAEKKKAELDAAEKGNDDQITDAEKAALEDDNDGPDGEEIIPVSAGKRAKEVLNQRRERAEAAHANLRNIAMSYPGTTPNEHTIFGYGGFRFTLGELRDLFGLVGPRD